MTDIIPHSNSVSHPGMAVDTKSKIIRMTGICSICFRMICKIWKIFSTVDLWFSILLLEFSTSPIVILASLNLGIIDYTNISLHKPRPAE